MARRNGGDDEGRPRQHGDLKDGAVPKATFRELLAFAAPHRAAIVVALALGILGSLAALAQPNR